MDNNTDSHQASSSPQAQAATSGIVDAPPKQAACLACRSIKIKCLRDENATTCNRCSNKGLTCTIPDYRVGRRKGVPNKRRGLDKAIHQLEQALNDAKATSESGNTEADCSNAAQRLQQLLNEAGAVLNHSQTGRLASPRRTPSSSTLPTAPGPSSSSTTNLAPQNGPRQVVQDTENPLQLLAHATEQCLPLPQLSASTNAGQAATSNVRDESNHVLRSFFGPPRVNLDVGPSLDPVSLGFVTLVEAEDLVSYFHENLSHTRWGLDPALHTAKWIRQRSAFLFTSVMAASAKFIPMAGALSTRLTAHCKTLANHVMNNRHRSVEIVIAFMFNVPWLPAGKHWEDDEGSSFLANALAIALDLSLDKVIVSSADSQTRVGLAGRDMVDAKKALALDGFENVDPETMLGRRLLRRRERVWLALFILDRGFCMARERRSLFPMDTPLLQRCDDWYISDIGTSADSSLISIAVLRRDLIGVIAKVRSRCDHYQPGTDDGTTVAESIRDMIENFLANWFTTWAPIVADWKENQLPPYVEILSCHTRLSIYGLVMNHPTAPPEVYRFFRVGGLSASINVMRTAVQGEALWKSVPNNTVIMIAFAACLALKLSNTQPETNPAIAQSVRSLVHQTADVFERIGSTPAHRQGASVLYAKHLRAMVQRYHPEQVGTEVVNSGPHTHFGKANPIQDDAMDEETMQKTRHQEAHQAHAYHNDQQPMFAAMSDVEFSEALKSVEMELFATEGVISADWWNNLDWLTWDDRVPTDESLLLLPS